jgi:hypothetical protein
MSHVVHRRSEKDIYTFKQIIMQSFKTILSAFILLITVTATAQTKTVDHFTKVNVSPYIQMTFVQGDEESVTINDIAVDKNKLHVEVNDKTLRIYLEGAKDISKNEKDYSDDDVEMHSLYRNTSVVATVTYKTLDALSVRGEEEHVCKSAIDGKKFTLKIYGESEVTFNELNLQELHATLYGEGSVKIKSGSVKEQDYTCYGEGRVNSLAVTGVTGRVTAYGDADIKINVSDRIKITSFGDAQIHYKGDPEVVKGLHIGDLLVDRMD